MKYRAFISPEMNGTLQETQAPEAQAQHCAPDEIVPFATGQPPADGNESDAEGSVREGPPVLNPLQLISSAAIHKPAVCARQPCRRDLSVQVSVPCSLDRNIKEGQGSRTTGGKKRPQCVEHGCFRYGNYHRCSINASESPTCVQE